MRKTIYNYPRYQVSDKGYVRNKLTGRILKPGDARGYKFVVLTNGDKGHAIYVHKLVAEAFLGHCPEGKEIDHDDDDKSNNKLCNLQYITHVQNVRKNKRSQLNMKYVDAIRKCYTSGWFSLSLLADWFEVDICTISDVIHNRTWIENV